MYHNYAGHERGYSIVVCICPLNSLMTDQRQKFLSMGVSVEESYHDPEVIKRIVGGSVPLVFISPENIINNPDMLQSRIYKERMVTLAVDEAHCIKTWYVLYTSILFDIALNNYCYIGAVTILEQHFLL